MKDVSSRDIVNSYGQRMVRNNSYFINFQRSQFHNFHNFLLQNGSKSQGVPSINSLSCVKLQISYLRLTMKANFSHLILIVNNFYRICAVLVFCAVRGIDFKFFFKFYSRRSFWWLIFEIFLLLELIKQFDCN